MKLFTIFWKNLRTVSRNPNYFIILVVCPIALILLAGYIFNSINFSNIRVGAVEGEDLNVQSIYSSSIISYVAIEDCIKDLMRSDINVCIKLNTYPNGRQSIEVYLDNSRKIIESYGRQIILENVLNKQSSLMQETSDELGSKISLMTNSIEEAKSELDRADIEMQQEEKMISDYRINLSILRSNFEVAYQNLKLFDSQFRQYRTSQNQNNLANAVSDLRVRRNQISSQINNLRNLLSNKLIPADYNLANTYLQEMTNSLQAIDNDLVVIEAFTNQNNLENLLRTYDNMLIQAENIRDILNQADRDLLDAQNRISQGRERLRQFRQKLEEGQNQMNSFNGIDSKILSVDFKDSFSISDDPVKLSFPLLIVMIISLSAVIMPNMFILRKVNQASYLRDIISPTSRFTLMFGDYLINLFFISIQIVALFIIGVFWFNLYYLMDNSLSFFISMFLGASVFIFIGMIFGYLIKSQSISSIISLFIVLIFYILSDIFVPATLADPFARLLIELNPFFILEQLIFGLTLLNQTILEYQSNIVRLVIFFALGVLFSYIAKKISEREALRDF